MASDGEQSARQVLHTYNARTHAPQTRDTGLARADDGNCQDSRRFAGRVVMALFKRVMAGFQGLFRKTQLEQELDAELVEFLESSTEQKIRAGLSRDQAVRAARMELGSVAAVKDHVRDVGWESVLDGVGQDLRYACRSLRKSPSFAAAAILTL